MLGRFALALAAAIEHLSPLVVRFAIRGAIMLAVTLFAVAGEAATTGKTMSDSVSFYDLVEIAVGTYCATKIGPVQDRLTKVEKVCAEMGRQIVELLRHVAPRTTVKDHA